MKKDETDCTHCSYPHTCKVLKKAHGHGYSRKGRGDPKKAVAPLYKVDACFDIAGIGKIPILRGDHNLLPDKVKDFIVEQITVLRPAAVVICTGTVFEEEYMKELLIKEGRLHHFPKYDNVYSAHADPNDHVSLGGRIFVDQDFCHTSSSELECDGIHHNLGIPSVRKRACDELYSNLIHSMRGRTMYVVPFSAGPIGGRFSVNAVQLTDCPYTVLTTRILSRVSSAVWDSIGTGDFIRCVHSVGAPRPVSSPALYMWPNNSAQAFALINMRSKKIYSYGSAHFANAICRSSMCLRMGSVIGRENGFHAESAAIISISDPNGEEVFACVQGALGSGKNTIAMLQSTLPGWTVRPLSSTFAWIRWHTDGKMYAMSPENGFCLQWSYKENMKDKQPVEAKAIRKRSLLLNVAENPSGELHWVGRDDLPAMGDASSPMSPSVAHLPRAKSCAVVAASDVETMHPAWDSPMGVPISAYIFLSNRPDTVPVIQESPNWKDGIALAVSQRTVKGTGIDHETLVYNPLGMQSYSPFGLNEYVKGWFEMEKEGRKMPKIFHLNLFRRAGSFELQSAISPATVTPSTSNTSLDAKSDKSSIFDRPITPPPEIAIAPKDFTTVWPGFGENIRLLAWIHGRVLGKESAIGRPVEPLGTVIPASVNMEGLSGVDWDACISYDAKGWKEELSESIKKMKNTALMYPPERAHFLQFLARTKAKVKASLGEKTNMSAEPIKDDKEKVIVIDQLKQEEKKETTNENGKVKSGEKKSKENEDPTQPDSEKK